MDSEEYQIIALKAILIQSIDYSNIQAIKLAKLRYGALPGVNIAATAN